MIRFINFRAWGAALKESFRKLFQLSPQRKAWPGHDVPGVVGRDRAEDA